MLDRIIRYFAAHHMLGNYISIGIFLGAIISWQFIGKEEMPNFELNTISISAKYPGATPEDVEQLVTKRIETELKSIDGVYLLKSTSTVGSSSIQIDFVPGYDDMAEALNDIRSLVANVKLPSEIRDPPQIRQYKTSRRSVIDIGIYMTNRILLTPEERSVLQGYAFNLSDQIEALPEVSEVSSSGYYKNELQVLLNPARLLEYNIPASEVVTVLKKHNLRVPSGSLVDRLDTKVTVTAELDTVEKLNELVVRSGFDSPAIRLRDIATVRRGFEKNNAIRKINGREGVTLNVRKTTATDIIQATDAIRAFVDRYQATVMKGSGVATQLINDKSTEVRNRIDLIIENGIMGFALILVFLFLFMDFISAFWVAMCIPFTFSVTIILFPLLGYTINNITLAGIIIVMGMIVNQAIVVSENIARKRSSGVPTMEAITGGTREMVMPILGSVTTTCVGFLPLFFFSGRFGQMLVFIPPVVTVMLFASFFESLFILPAHLDMHLSPGLRKFVGRLRLFRRSAGAVARIHPGSASAGTHEKIPGEEKTHWFMNIEHRYARILYRVLPHRVFVLAAFTVLLVLSGLLFTSQFKFVLFPDEETNAVTISGFVKKGSGKAETERIVRGIENVLEKDRPDNVIACRSTIAQGRRGGTSDQTSFSISVEILPRDNRTKATDELLRSWRRDVAALPDIDRVTFATVRFGSSGGSGSAIEVEVRENDDGIRRKAADAVRDALILLPGIRNAEVDEPPRNPEYRIGFDRELLARLGVNPADIATSLRTVLEGTVIDELNGGDEEVDLRVSVEEKYKTELPLLLQNPVENNSTYLVPLARVVNYEKVFAPSTITRVFHKRTTMVYADLSGKDRGTKESPKTNGRAGEPVTRSTDGQTARMRGPAMTPVEIAAYLEQNVFPKIQQKYPGVIFAFSGEIKDTRESSGDILMASLLVTFLIFVNLALIFNNALRPLLVMLTIPFGLVGVILTFWSHGIEYFGLFGAIGALGLAGVVINDSILLIDKLDREIGAKGWGGTLFERIANIASTRLRAVALTTLTAVAGLMPTAYGIGGYDAMLAQMMLALSWGLLFGMFITLLLIPCFYSFLRHPDPETDNAPAPDGTGDSTAASRKPGATGQRRKKTAGGQT